MFALIVHLSEKKNNDFVIPFILQSVKANQQGQWVGRQQEEVTIVQLPMSNQQQTRAQGTA